MKTSSIVSVVFCIFSLSLALPVPALEKSKPKPKDAPDATIVDPNAIYGLSGPYTHQNLSIWLVEDKKQSGADKDYLTLQEALEKKLVTIVETGSVGNLTIINHAENVNIFIQSGDIVKGGRQDRTIQYDYVLTPQQKELSLNSFCVEHGRWSKRGEEASDKFSSSTDRLSSRELQVAARYEGNQSRVWQEVKSDQEKLSKNVGQSVQSPQSASSLQLTLEDKDLKEFINAYMEKLSPVVRDKTRPAGLVVAINGRFVSADIYESEKLFIKLWDKLLRAAAVEAVAEYQKDKKYEGPTLEQVKQFLSIQYVTGQKKVPIAGSSLMRIVETKDKVIFDTCSDSQSESKPVHRNYLYWDEKDQSAAQEDKMSQTQVQSTRK